MGIRQIQIQRIIEKIVKSYLFRGRYPTFQTITHQFSHWLQENTPGAPSFHPLKVFRKEKSESKRYNENIQMIYQDIGDAYESTIQQTNRIMTDFQFTETERGKIRHELKELSKQIDEILMLQEQTDQRYLNGKILSFHSLDGVDQSHSTAYVHLPHQCAMLHENIQRSRRVLVDANKVRFQPLTKVTKHEALESISSAFDDNVNTAWWHVVKNKEAGSVRAELIIPFTQEEEINEISYVAHHSDPMYVQIEYTLDGMTYLALPEKNNDRKVIGSMAWSFMGIKAKGIKFVFEKKEHNDHSAGMYQYYFGAKQIQITKKEYVSEGILVSQPISFEKGIRQLAIQAKQEIPFHTNVEYAVALYDDSKLISDHIWYPISSIQDTQPKFAKVVEFQENEVQHVEFEQAGPSGETINGMTVFRLIKDNESSILSDQIINTETGETKEAFHQILHPKLFRGINQWKRERTYIPFDGMIPIQNRWEEQYQQRPQSIQIDYWAQGNTLNLRREAGGGQDNFYRFTICIHSDEVKSFPLAISIIKTMGSGIKKRLGAYSVYMNQKRLIPENDEVTLSFQMGWNEIQILYHFGDLQNRSDFPENSLPNETYLGKFNFAKEKKVRAEMEYMKETDVHSLYHNLSPNNRDYFAIHERQVVLNYNPSHCVFQLLYETGQVREEEKQVLVKALLTRSEEAVHVTPKIYQIQLRTT